MGGVRAMVCSTWLHAVAAFRKFCTGLESCAHEKTPWKSAWMATYMMAMEMVQPGPVLSASSNSSPNAEARVLPTSLMLS